MSFDWSKMDYIGFAYSALVAGGGVFGKHINCVVRFVNEANVNKNTTFLFSGYIKAQSVPSLVAGLTFGALLAGGAYLNSSEPPRPLLQL